MKIKYDEDIIIEVEREFVAFIYGDEEIVVDRSPSLIWVLEDLLQREKRGQFQGLKCIMKGSLYVVGPIEMCRGELENLIKTLRG